MLNGSFTIPVKKDDSGQGELRSDKNELTIMFKFPDNNLFSKIHPSGISIRCPSLATTVVFD